MSKKSLDFARPDGTKGHKEVKNETKPAAEKKQNATVSANDFSQKNSTLAQKQNIFGNGVIGDGKPVDVKKTVEPKKEAISAKNFTVGPTTGSMNLPQMLSQ